MELDVAVPFVQVTQCFACETLEDGKVLVGLCTTSGQLLEFIDKKVVDSLDIDKDADDIKIFTSYDPVQRYYLLRCKKQLIVVKRAKPLCILKTYDDVAEVQIRDRLCIGRPQAVIWTLTEKEPLVTDFVRQLQPTGSQTVPHITTNLSGKLQEMNLRLVKARKLLQEKRRTRVNAVYDLTHVPPPPDTHADSQDEEPKVLIWGPPLPTQVSASQPPLQVSQPWRRAHNAKWIVGVPLFNTSDTAVSDVRLRLQMDSLPEVSYHTHTVVFPQRSSSGAEWTELRQHRPLFLTQQDVPGLTPAVVVGVFEEPHFNKSPVVSITGAILYRHNSRSGREIQDILRPVIQFSVEDMIQGNLLPFSSDQEHFNESDLVSVAVTSALWHLQVSSRHHMAAALQLGDYGLQHVPTLGCWVGRHGSLKGLLLLHRQLSDTQHQLDVYARDSKQGALLVHSLNSVWRVDECKESAASLSDCVQSLAAELKLLRTAAQPNKQLGAEEWATFRKQLNDLELATDKTFATYKPHE